MRKSGLMGSIMVAILVLIMFAAGMLNNNINTTNDSSPNTNTDLADDTLAQVVWVADGDTIDVEVEGERYRVRYIGVNTPERDEVCYVTATDANRTLVEGKTVRLVKDVSDTDRHGRLLRYVYVDDVFVNEELIVGGFAESVLYQPDERHYNNFRNLERQAASQGLGCHTTGIFNDGSSTR